MRERHALHLGLVAPRREQSQQRDRSPLVAREGKRDTPPP